jgi:HlyD family secretion protein
LRSYPQSSKSVGKTPPLRHPEQNSQNRGSSRVLSLGVVLLLGVAIGAAAFFIYGTANERAAGAADQVPAEDSAPPLGIAALGHIEAEGDNILVGARSLSGQPSIIAELRVKEGDHVQVGQEIAVLNSKEQLEAAIRQTEANVKVAETRLAQVRAGAKSAELSAQEAEIARLESELQGAQTVYRRTQALQAQGAATGAALDAAQVPVQTLTKAIAQAKERLRSLSEIRTVDVAVAESELEAAVAAVKRAQSEYAAAFVRSPYKGRVLKIHAWRGEEVGPSGVVEIARTDRMYAIAEVVESDISRVRVGQRAEITGDSLSGKLHGVVTEIGSTVGGNTVRNMNPVTNSDKRIVEVKVLLDDGKVAENLLHARVQVIITP